MNIFKESLRSSGLTPKAIEQILNNQEKLNKIPNLIDESTKNCHSEVDSYYDLIKSIKNTLHSDGFGEKK